ncbi:biopolymer transporter ExbB [Thioclava sp. SK-1]|uniref:biopolymer transporter ExbB n=1 Tax=Thioclava sp. SK-1 TaxID=1889770 RepID=UPI000825BD97|nr:biopolymer transporter ExbB [Thioclava sp. SK-1]OCX66120.1 biopolymer transporter ExbB [Thioclava sp. SK-1]
MSDQKIRLDPQFSQPVRQVLMMLVVLGLVGVGGWFAYARIFPIFLANPWLNGVIATVFVAGVLACFWQVVQLVKAVVWIESFAADRPGRPNVNAPSMLAPLASLLGARGRGQIATSATRSILESVGTRIDEARDITRYVTGLLIFLGLLGTFYGLATTVPAVVETIRALAPQEGESSIAVFDKLMTGLEAQLGGMGTAFSSSLLGLAGSLVVGLLELFVTHGQNRFYRELEEWLSSITRLSFAAIDGDNGEGSIVAEILDHMSEQMEGLQRMFSDADASRAQVDARLGQMSYVMESLAERLGHEVDARAAQAQALEHMAHGQDRLIAALEGLAARHDADQSAETDAEMRMRMRSIDGQMARMLEELSAGRQESMAELRNDFAALTRALLSRNRES